MTALAFAIEKAPDGGYALRKIEVRDGKVVHFDAIKFADSQPEIWRKLHQLGEETFQETAWIEKVIEHHFIREVPTVQRAPQPPVPMPQAQPDDPLPNVVQDMQANPPRPPQHPTVEKARSLFNGRTNALAWLALLTISYMASGMA